MRILHVTHQYRPALGGSEEYLTGLCEGLAARGHHVTVLAARSTDYLTWTGELPQREVLDGVNVHRFRALRRGPLTWRVLHLGLDRGLRSDSLAWAPLVVAGNGPLCPGMIPALLRELPKHDLVHLNSLHYAPATYGFVVARALKVPIAITPHVHVEQRDTWDLPHLRRILIGADLVLAQTELERRFHDSRGHGRDHVALAGVGLRPERLVFPSRAAARRELGLPDDAPVVLFLGRLVEYKGPERVVRAVEAIRARHPDARCLVVGPPTPWSETALAPWRDRPWLRLLGQVSDTVKCQALAAANVLAMPSAGEALGITYLEAWLAGLPVVGLRLGAVADLVDDGVTGLLVAPGDDRALVGALETLLGDPALSARMAARGAEGALLKYSLERVVSRVETACAALLARRGSAECASPS